MIAANIFQIYSTKAPKAKMFELIFDLDAFRCDDCN